MKRKPEETEIKIHNTCKLMHRQKDGQKDGSEYRRTNEEKGKSKKCISHFQPQNAFHSIS
jgi:hypothetical protein